MKTIFFSVFFAIAISSIGELSDADLDKIRLIVNDAEKRIKANTQGDRQI